MTFSNLQTASGSFPKGALGHLIPVVAGLGEEGQIWCGFPVLGDFSGGEPEPDAPLGHSTNVVQKGGIAHARHSALTDRVHRAACEFRLGLDASSRSTFMPDFE